MKKILCIVQLPPPVHGVSVMNNIVVHSSVIRSIYTIEIFKLNHSLKINEVGRFTLLKCFKVIRDAFILLKVVLVFKPDMVYYSFTPVGTGFYRDALYVFILRLCRKVLIFHLHGKGIKAATGKSRVRKQLYRILFHQVNTISLSKTLASDLEDLHFRSNYIISNGIEVLSGLKKEKTDKKEGDPLQILFLSNYSISKGILVLIEALHILALRKVPFRAVLAGGDHDFKLKQLNDLINDASLASQIKAVGPVSGSSKYALFTSSDILVHPTLNDAFPLVILEAFQFGLPVIATNEGAIPEIITENVNGFLVNKGDAVELAGKIGSLIFHPEWRERMSKVNSETFLAHYTSSIFETNLLHSFNEICTNL